MNPIEQPHLEIADLPFSAPDEEQSGWISDYFSKMSMLSFQKRLRLSVLICCLVFVMQLSAHLIAYEGAVLKSHILTLCFLIVLAFVIFNLISFAYARIMLSLNTILDHCECIQGVVTECFDSRTLSKKTREQVPNYLLFQTADALCTTALPVKDEKKFLSTKVDAPILVLKLCPMGRIKYDYFLTDTN